MEYVTQADDRIIELRGAVVPPHSSASVGGLVGGFRRGQPHLLTGIVMGPVRVTVEVRATEPGAMAEGWEDVVDISCGVVEPPILATGPYDVGPGAQFALEPDGAESFRLRVHARRRDAAFDQAVSEVVEEYLLISWPAPPEPARVHTVGSDLARRLYHSTQEASSSSLRNTASTARPAPGFVESAQDATLRAAAEANLQRIAREKHSRRRAL